VYSKLTKTQWWESKKFFFLNRYGWQIEVGSVLGLEIFSQVEISF
jgi:hypothetical protein